MKVAEFSFWSVVATIAGLLSVSVAPSAAQDPIRGGVPAASSPFSVEVDAPRLSSSRTVMPSPLFSPSVRRYFVSVHDWTILRNKPQSYAIGNGKYGWTFDSSALSTGSGGYLLGFLYGDFWGCAWTAQGNVSSKSGTPSDVCSSWISNSPPIENFASLLNCLGCNGGTPVLMVGDSAEFANYSESAGPYDEIRTQLSGHCVEWRWISTDGSVAMVKDRSFADNLGSWIFVRRSALPADADLPSGSAGACPA